MLYFRRARIDEQASGGGEVLFDTDCEPGGEQGRRVGSQMIGYSSGIDR